jgi:hypothetical protein
MSMYVELVELTRHDLASHDGRKADRAKNLKDVVEKSLIQAGRMRQEELAEQETD